MPSFPGGEKKMYEFLSENIKYPQLARESGIQGKVFVEFVVEADGSISNVKLRRGIGGGCDEEVMRIVKLMPKWNPGKQRGKPVRVRYILPAMFKLNSGEEKTLLPLPTSNGRPDYVYDFSKWSSEVYNTTNTISQDAMLEETLNNYKVTGFRIVGWSLYQEQESIIEKRVKSVESHIKSIIQQSGKNVSNYSFETKCYGPDWMKFIETIQNSDISDSDYIIKRILNSSNPEQTIQDLIMQYPELEKKVLPKLRCVEVYVH